MKSVIHYSKYRKLGKNYSMFAEITRFIACEVILPAIVIGAIYGLAFWLSK